MGHKLPENLTSNASHDHNGDHITHETASWALNYSSGTSMRRTRSYSRVTKQAISILGKLIKVGRLERGLTAAELSERAGITRKTLRRIESGEPGSEIGIVFEVASLVGVRLFEFDDPILRMHNARLDEKLTLLPKSVRASGSKVDDDF